MASTVRILIDAGRLRVLLSGAVDLADEATLGRILDLLADYTPDERAQVAAKAVELGADPAVVQGIMSILTPEVIEVHGRASRGRAWLWLLLIVGGAAATGGGLGYRDRRRRQALRGPW